MKNISISVCCAALTFVSIQHGFSQSSALLQQSITHVYTDVNEDPGRDDNFRWRVWINEIEVTAQRGCIRIDGDAGWHQLAPPLQIDSISLSNIHNPLPIRIAGWDNDDDRECTYSNDDEGITDQEAFLRQPLARYQPGITYTENIYVGNNYRYAIRYEFSYRVPKPQTPTVAAPSSDIICDVNPTIQLSSASFLHTEFQRQTQFLWEYKIGPVGVWRCVKSASSLFCLPQSRESEDEGTFRFDNIRSMAGLANITQLTDVYFRVRTFYTATDGSVFESPPSSQSTAIKLGPVAPTINSVTSTPSCPDQNSTGTVTATVSGLFGEYLYILRAGEDIVPCHPDSIPGKCGGSPSGRIFGNTLTIRNVPPGRHTLIVSNPSGNAGVCYDYKNIDVGAIPALQLNAPDITHVSCQGGTDGAVVLTYSGGKSPWQYSLTKPGFSAQSKDGNFTSLSAGNYTATVTDDCGPPVTVPVSITEPRKAEATVLVSNPFCNNPPDASITVNITQGEGRYSYRLLKNGEPVQQLNDVSITEWQVNGLGAGTYTLEVKDPQRLQCEGFTAPVELFAAPAFEIAPENITIQNLSCFEAGNGSIRLQPGDESEAFQYLLSSENNNTRMSTLPDFSSLPAGTYSLSMKRNREGCQDRFDFPQNIEVTQPEQVTLTLNARSISCYGQTNGAITASVAGATASDQYQWEIKIGENWASLNATASAIENLSAGLYRMKLSNANNCQALSEEVEIIEPGLLEILNVETKDIICLGAQGEVEVALNGGTAPFSYTFTAPSAIEQSPSPRTGLAAGVYALEVTDANGCNTNHPQPIIITAPPSPLSLTYTLSDFNGYNVSCYGAANGLVNLNVSGGNGGGYSGYEYRLDNGIPQASPRIRNISAGEHTVVVRDARGCEVARTLTLTEPASELVTTLESKKDVLCLGDTNGELLLSTTGGLAPYTYTLNQLREQASGLFPALEAGDYTIAVSDNNGCTDEFQATIETRTPPIEITLLKTDITCQGAADGSAQADVSGGASPLLYTWRDNAGNTVDNSRLAAGTYSLNVTDAQGCAQEKQVTLLEPEAISAVITSIPVCIGKANGELRLAANGGTAPYRYSINDGNTFQDNGTFQSVPAGIYQLRLVDQNNCPLTAQAEIKVRNDLPRPNFIVATQQNALDTLVIREISVPEPDSVQWFFDPGLEVVGNDPRAPQVKAGGPGNFLITMKGFFGGCDYVHSLTLTIDPFDPERHNGKATAINGIREVSVSPNPSAGLFTVTVRLSAKQRMVMKIMDVLGTVYFNQRWENILGISQEVDALAALQPGVYFIQVVTDTDARETRIVIER